MAHNQNDEHASLGIRIRVNALSEKQAKLALEVMRQVGVITDAVYEKIISLVEATPYED